MSNVIQKVAEPVAVTRFKVIGKTTNTFSQSNEGGGGGDT
jgi:hypothetical protein